MDPWSQLQLRAIAGPAAAGGTELALLPAELAHWGDWLERHPDTTVITGRTDYKPRYKRNPYGHYFETGRPRFPVSPLPVTDDPAWMARAMVLRQDEGWQVLVYDDPRTPASEQPQRWQNPQGLDLVWRPHASGMEPPTLRAAAGDAPVEAIYTFWFAWHAVYPSAPPPQRVPPPAQ